MSTSTDKTNHSLSSEAGADAIRKYVQNDILADTGITITDEQDLLLSGLLDSLSVIRVATFLEEHFKIKVAAEDLIVENFGSCNSMASYVHSKLSQGAN